MFRSEIIDTFDDVKDLPALERTTARVAQDLDVFYSYICWPSDAPPFLLTNYSQAWRQRFLQARYDRIDPLTIRARGELLPFLWDAAELPHLTSTQRQLFAEAGEFGIRRGMTVPIHHGAGTMAKFTVVTSERMSAFAKKIKPDRHLIHLIALHLDAVAWHLLAADARPGARLTRREAECLRWTARGKSSFEIAQILSIARRTVVFHVENAKRKLGVNTARQALIEAIRQGLPIN